jgi:DNA-directed RNA polymerase specialized sigma24 family protein
MDDDVLVKVEDGTVTALLVYGAISSARLRTLNLSRLSLVADAPPERTWEQHEPPTPRDIARGHRKVNPTQFVADVQLRAYIERNGSRREGETAEEFYTRFAQVVTHVAFSAKSPSKAIAEALDIDTATVDQYIHRCRKRGLLQPSPRSAR